MSEIAKTTFFMMISFLFYKLLVSSFLEAFYEVFLWYSGKMAGRKRFCCCCKKHTFGTYVVVHISFFFFIFVSFYVYTYLVNSWVLCGQRKKYIIRSRLFYDIEVFKFVFIYTLQHMHECICIPILT